MAPFALLTSVPKAFILGAAIVVLFGMLAIAEAFRKEVLLYSDILESVAPLPKTPKGPHAALGSSLNGASASSWTLRTSEPVKDEGW